MHANPNLPGEHFFKNTNAQSVQINAAVGACFQTQNKSNSTVENNTYEDITLNQMQCKEHRNEQMQQHQDV